MFFAVAKTLPLTGSGDVGVPTASGGGNAELIYLNDLCSPPMGMRTNHSSVHFAVQSLTPYGKLN